MAKNVLVLKHFESPKEAGVYHRLVCLTGSGKGQSYVLKGNRVVIGRSEKADIRLVDVKASREHAEVTKVGKHWVATDLGSQNGIMVNDEKVVQKELTEGDKLIIGQTVFKFAKVEVSNKIRLGSEDPDSGEPVDQKSKLPFVILVVIVMAIFLMDDDKQSVEKSTRSSEVGQPDASAEFQELKKRQAKEDKQLKERLNVIYQRGLREYREGNYFRAIQEFNLALIHAPGDASAEYYLRKTKEDLDKTIEGFMNRAQQDEDSLKYQSAIVAYCSIIRLLYAAPEDLRYKNAENKIKSLENSLGLEPGETNCIKKPRTN
jgi:pSer/pThr/pTyr-binding forkhead associated (FHA) protein